MWWRYALESVLVDARKKLKKTSWRYLGQRLACRRKYVQQYKTKLEYLQKEQPVDSSVLLELEKMEKDNDISDILIFRSIAERKIEHSPLIFSSGEPRDGGKVSGDKLQLDEPSSRKARGWLNWLSRGVLGAGGTDDSVHFSGVVSDEIIKDICEATKFQPGSSMDFKDSADDVAFIAALNLSVNEISLAVRNRMLGQEVARMSLSAVVVDGRMSDDSSIITVKIDSAGILDLLKNVDVLQIKKSVQSFTSFQVDISHLCHEADLVLKVMLQPLEIYCDLDLVPHLIELFNVLKNWKLQRYLVFMSLNGLKDDNARLLSKAEIILKDETRVIWDVSFCDVTIHMPCFDMDVGSYGIVLDARNLHVESQSDRSSFASEAEHGSFNLDYLLELVHSSNMYNKFDLKRFYTYFKVSLCDFQIRLFIPSIPKGISVLDNSSASVMLASCIIPEEMILARLVVHVTLPLLQFHLSPLICGTILRIAGHMRHLYSKSGPPNVMTFGSNDFIRTDLEVPFRYGLAANIGLVKWEIRLEDEDTKNSVLFSLGDLDIRYVCAEFEDGLMYVKSLNMASYAQGTDAGSHILLSSYFQTEVNIDLQQKIDFRNSEKCATGDGCFHLHYRKKRIGVLVQHSWDAFFNDTEVHCYPKVVGLLTRFCYKLSECHGTGADGNSVCSMESSCSDDHLLCFNRFGLSNFYENGFSGWDSISCDHFPFVTIHNSCSLRNLEESLIYPISEWRTHFNVMNKRIRSSPSENLGLPVNVFFNEASEISLIENSGNSSVTRMDLAVSNLKLHFHDSSSTVGTITAPLGKASVTSSADFLDLLCSIEGLSLSSVWWKKKSQEYLWGPSLPNFSPILNFRLKKGSACPGTSLELSFGVQHVCCIIPPEYLAIIIGYFSLPDWSFYDNEDLEVHEQTHAAVEVGRVVMFKFEVLDSTILSPIANNETFFLKLQMPQLYCSFIQNDALNNLLSGVTPECMLPADKIGDSFNSVNIFGRGLHLCVFSSCINNSILLHEAGRECSTLIQSVNADLWIRIPSVNPSLTMTFTPVTLIMSRIAGCELLLGGLFSKPGFEALLEIIDQYSAVEKQSNCFLYDVPQFLQLKNSLLANPLFPSDESSISLMEIKVCANASSLWLCQTSDSGSLDMVANLDMAFALSVSLQNESVSKLDIYFSSLVLHSLLNSVTLVKCISDSSVSSALMVCFITVEDGDDEVFVSLPALDVWMHWPNWTAVFDVLSLYFEHSSPAFGVEIAKSTSDILGLTENMVISQDSLESLGISTYTESKIMASDVKANITMRSESVVLFCHFPVSGSEQNFGNLDKADARSERRLNDSRIETVNEQCKAFTITCNIRSLDLIVKGATVKLKSTWEKITGTMEIWESGGTQSCALLQLSNLRLDLEPSDYMLGEINVKGDLHCDACDIWMSRQSLFFWHDVEFRSAEANSSEVFGFILDLSVDCRKISFLLTDGTWSCNEPLMHLVTRNVLSKNTISGGSLRSSVVGDLLINYNNIRKVSWEPFIEPWNFQLFITSLHERTALLDSSILKDILLKSTEQLNVNVTEPLLEVIFRMIEMIKDSQILMSLNGISENHGFQTYQLFESPSARSYAPYVIHNLTSLPFVFFVYGGSIGDNLDVSASILENAVPPGSSVPIYLDESGEEKVLHYRPGNSFDGLSKKQSNVMGHHFVTIQFEGTPVPSQPISMDLAGLTYFEVNFSKENSKTDVDTGFLVPVVFDVSVERYSKIIRLYSTVLLLNLASVPLELRFDIPFGISPKIIDPIYPGQEFHLPLHLAEVGQIRWRPVGDNYLWSESYNLSNILSPDNRAGLLRPLVCYPASPNSDPFRCCLSVQDMSLPLCSVPKNSSSHLVSLTLSQTANIHEPLRNPVKSRSIHQVMLFTPLLVKNYLLQPASLRIESGGVSRSMLLSEVETSFFTVDSSHDLVMSLEICDFKPSSIKFPRAETFSSMAKPNGTFLSLIETIALHADSSEGIVHVTVEKMLDASSGARQLRISVPFLLYNCTGYAFFISRSDNGIKGNCCLVPSCYYRKGPGPIVREKDGLGLISSNKTLQLGHNDSAANSHVYSRANMHQNSSMLPTDSSIFCGSSLTNNGGLDFHGTNGCGSSLRGELGVEFLSDFTSPSLVNNGDVHVQPFMYSPDPSVPASEITVRISKHIPEQAMDNQSKSSWSNSFFLLAPSGSTTVFVPDSSSNSISVISVASNLLDNPFSGRTRAITFQPRYVISNASSKDLSYKQKGTGDVFHLLVGQHSHLHWPDITREMLVSVRLSEMGWQWSGGFSPDHLGDTQVKVRNYRTGALHMLRVEVQNADIVHDEKILGDTSTNSGTVLIILSDDDSGFIPYRIENFSNEKLRIYQQHCETLETIVDPYTSCSYAWDEPCFPHRLIVEVPGERIIGAYTLDDVKEYTPVHLPSSSSSKLERTLLSSVHAEGALKVLSVVDSTCHAVRDVKRPVSSIMHDAMTQDQKEPKLDKYKENISVVIPFVGISFINSSPLELLFASAVDIKIDLFQNLEKQQIYFRISSLQIDNMLRSTPYPVVLYFDQEHQNNRNVHIRSKSSLGKNMNVSLGQFPSGRSSEPVIYFSAAKWRNKDMMLRSFEHISLRIADFHLEVDQEVLLIILEFLRVAMSMFCSPYVPITKSELVSNHSQKDLATVSDACMAKSPDLSQVNGHLNFSQYCNFPERLFSSTTSLPKVVPMGAPWQKIYLLARRHNKIYVEMFNLTPTKLTVSFSSSPWMLKNVALASGESLVHRGLLALADIEGAQMSLKKLTITHHIGSWESMRDIIIKHYSKQCLHEMYKLFGSAGVMGNPMGFARRVGLGIKDFLSVPAQGVLQSPAGLVTGVAQGTGSLVSNTLYAISDAATQFSKAAHKGLMAFTFDTSDGDELENQQIAASSYSKGVISDLLEGFTDLLQSPIRGAEKHGLPGVLSGFAMGVTGLVAKPAASVLEATGRTALSIRNRSKLHRMKNQRLRVRLPRPLRRDLPLRPYSWEEAVGTAVLIEAHDGSRFEDEVLVICKRLKDLGKFVVVSERLILVVECPSLVDLGNAEFRGISADPEWIVEVEISLESVIHADVDDGVVHIVGSGSETSWRRNLHQQKRAGGGSSSRWNRSSLLLPLFQTDLVLACKEDADYFLRVLLSTIEQGKQQGWGNTHLLHQSSLRYS
ncbi:hypothetical protein Drorol1_Dr00017059 [Drosera rotundifolia]